jgi:two-component system, OmpR family, response regulator ResD
VWVGCSRGRAFSRDELMRAVWQCSFSTDASTVTVHGRRLRAKLEDDATHPRYMKTVWGVGYRFEASLRSSALADATARP